MSIRRDGSLHIERVSVQDGGEYTCVAENVAGASNRTTTVNIYGNPLMLNVCAKRDLLYSSVQKSYAPANNA